MFTRKDPVLDALADDLILDGDRHDEAGAPLYVCIGSISGAKKGDVEAVVENLIQNQCQTPSLVKSMIVKDKANDRWVYEIHEGGPGFSLYHAFNVSEAPLYVKLTDNRVLFIEDSHAELVALTYTNRPDLLKEAADVPSSGKALTPYVRDETPLVKAGKVIFGAGLLALLVSYGSAFGLGYALQNDLLPNPYVTSAPTALNMELAAQLKLSQEALLATKDPFSYVRKLEKVNGQWVRELGQLTVPGVTPMDELEGDLWSADVQDEVESRVESSEAPNATVQGFHPTRPRR